jgi:hypothetical protein
MPDRLQLEADLSKAMSYQGYRLLRASGAPAERTMADGYTVMRFDKVILGAGFSASLEEVALWAQRTRVGQPSLWHGTGDLGEDR